MVPNITLTGHTKTDCFSIDTLTGLIQTTKQLDRESQEIFQLSAMVRDQTFISMSETARITILVLDRNDNSPYFEFPSLTNNTVHISNTLPLGYIVTRLIARDLDASDNRKLTLSLLVDSNYSSAAKDDNNNDDDDDDADEDDKFFAIDSELGSVTVKSALNEIDYRVFELRAQATDNGIPPRSTSTALLIVVNGTQPYLERMSKIEDNRFLFSPRNPFVYVIVSVTFGSLVVIASLLVISTNVRRKNEVKTRGPKNCRIETLRTHMMKDTCVSSAEGTPIKVSNRNTSMQGTHRCNYTEASKVTRSIQ